MINNCIVRPTVLKFKSEYELVHGSSPIYDATIISVSDSIIMLTALEVDLCKFYDQRPVIIICNKEQQDSLVALLMKNKLRHAVGASTRVLAEVRQWDYGVLLLSQEEGRGVDSRFRKDGVVLITS